MSTRRGPSGELTSEGRETPEIPSFVSILTRIAVRIGIARGSTSR
jgi:hypothetical protein